VLDVQTGNPSLNSCADRYCCNDSQQQRGSSGQFHDNEITHEQLKGPVGAEEAANLRILKQQFEEGIDDKVAEL